VGSNSQSVSRSSFPVNDNDDNPIGVINVPEDDSVVIVVAPGSPNFDKSKSEFDLVSVIVEVELFTTEGNAITSLSQEIQICIKSNATTQGNDRLCLGYLNDSGEWVCQDYCLTSNSNFLCGFTDHLTNFAILLDSNGGGSDDCDSESYAGVGIATAVSVGIALICMVGIVIVLEVGYFKRKQNKRKQILASAAATALNRTI